jgi:hypothetical protein
MVCLVATAANEHSTAAARPRPPSATRCVARRASSAKATAQTSGLTSMSVEKLSEPSRMTRPGAKAASRRSLTRRAVSRVTSTTSSTAPIRCTSRAVHGTGPKIATSGTHRKVKPGVYMKAAGSPRCGSVYTGWPLAICQAFHTM